jgi:hypothetical protein
MRVLIAKGTISFDVYDLSDMLAERGIDCVVCRWDDIDGPPGRYDAAVLFGLSQNLDVADMYAGAVRKAIGPRTRLLVVTGWDRRRIENAIIEKYDAEYFSRDCSNLTLLGVVLDMLAEDAKTAP